MVQNIVLNVYMGETLVFDRCCVCAMFTGYPPYGKKINAKKENFIKASFVSKVVQPKKIHSMGTSFRSIAACAA